MPIHVRRIVLLAAAIASIAAASSAAEGLRNIASVTATTYFNGDWRVESTDVFLARVWRPLTIEARITRVDTIGYFQHTFYLGPIVNFTDTIYASAIYGLGYDSAGELQHEIDAEADYETDTTATSLGVKADYFPSTGYYYFLPSVSGKFHPVPALGIFGKFFLSVDSIGVVTESFWGQADYRFSPWFAALAGFTVSRANAFGYSFIAGLDFSITRDIEVQYTIQYLSDTVEYITSPQPRSGLVNALVLDLRF